MPIGPLCYRGDDVNITGTKLKIHTLGCLGFSIEGKPVAVHWPDEALKVLFCSLLSPLNLSITWDRICRALWGVSETPSSRQQLEDTLILQLDCYLNEELGFNPVTSGDAGIKIDYQHIYVDAFEFHQSALEGLRLLSFSNYAAAQENFCRARTLYGGRYLSEISGKIIANTRTGLESLYRTTVLEANKLTPDNAISGSRRMSELGQYMNVSRNPDPASSYVSEGTA
jgi:two-component SAPR family response regulator